MRIRRTHALFALSFIGAVLLTVLGGFKEVETVEIVSLLTTVSATMAGFGLVAFQVARASSELRNDFIETSILMVLTTVAGFFYLVYPSRAFLTLNFGELSIFLFFWAFILFLLVLIDTRARVLR